MSHAPPPSPARAPAPSRPRTPAPSHTCRPRTPSSRPRTPAPALDVQVTLPPSLRASADLVIQSSDGTQFRVHKAYLAASSRFFEDMFGDETLAFLNESREDKQLPVVELSESRYTLRTLLPCVYPGTKPRPPSLRVLRDTLVAADKYDMPSVRDSMRPHLVWPEFLSTNPLLVWAISRLLEFEEEKKIAMEALFELNEEELFALEMDGVAASDLAVVHLRRQQRADAIIRVVQDVLAKDEGDKTPANCYRPICKVCKRVPMWVYVWTKRLEIDARKRPTIDKLFSYTSLENARQKSPRCRCSPDLIMWDPKSFDDLKKIVEDSVQPVKKRKSSLRLSKRFATS
ncbi:hypothetical protein DACRYDRAFT_105676 [Dacryopinax primogenitus]|uniref:BTB domain-containing protein n=1 Tax=Dacryopinax primogenitus (strain DJM 731) TaxID=1858805 RepID=M5GBS5_DACPD|nr:uncharacterized protein DACRYDRAFT_105676 [Dacryopinax primogenitus]EJU03517.1 hypothetical protein DACRYDRAFT_105676 [Dacryopinax primogenitus]